MPRPGLLLPSLLAVLAALAVPAAGAPASDRAFATPVVWKLRPEIQVDSEGIFQDQLFATDDEAPSPAHLRLASPPSVGQTLVLAQAQVLSLLRQLDPDFATPLAGAERVRISRRTRTLAENELLELLSNTLQRDYVRERGELELRLVRPWTPAAIPDEPFVLKIVDLPTLGVTPNFIVRFELQGSRERFADWQAVVQARVWRDVLVAHATLRRGSRLTGADMVAERRDILTLREPLETSAREDDSLELTEQVNPGSPLTARSVRVRPLVRRGRVVDAVIQDGALNISLKVEVLEDGQAGQTVRVRNPVSRRELSGKVLDEQTVAVTL